MRSSVLFLLLFCLNLFVQYPLNHTNLQNNSNYDFNASVRRFSVSLLPQIHTTVFVLRKVAPLGDRPASTELKRRPMPEWDSDPVKQGGRSADLVLSGVIRATVKVRYCDRNPKAPL